MSTNESENQNPKETLVKKEELQNNQHQKEVIRNNIPLNKWSSRSADIYKKINQVGEGSFGKVYKAKLEDPTSPNNQKIYALKKILMENEKEGFPITALREIMILKRLNHKNIISLIEVVTSKPKEKNKKIGNVYLVFEYMEHNISGLSKIKINYPIQCIKCILYQILEGLQYLHMNNIIHRDIKTANILLHNKGDIKIGDFGLARIINPSLKKGITNRVATLWYRAPELLFGENHYGPSIDMWSVGCVFSELLTGFPLFQGKREIDQIYKIIEKCGTPNESNWPGVTKLPLYDKFCPKKEFPFVLKRFFEDNRKVDDCCFDLLSKMLILDPNKRINVQDAMQHDFFLKNEPIMCKPEDLPKIPYDTHEYQMKKEIKNKINNLNNGGNAINAKGNMMIGKKDYKFNNVYNGKVNENEKKCGKKEIVNNINHNHFHNNNQINNYNQNIKNNNMNKDNDDKINNNLPNNNDKDNNNINNINNNLNNNNSNTDKNNNQNNNNTNKDINGNLNDNKIIFSNYKDNENIQKNEKKNIIESLLKESNKVDNIKDFLGKKREDK